ncbi:MAG TPA: recombinase family protein [Alphaproteobacteria bacterium]
MRYALYARYSSDRQSERSVEDQLRLCREKVTALGGTVVDEFSDYAISGASTINRPGFQGLMAAAREGRFDVVLSEALDRLSRGQADTVLLYDRLTHLRIPLITLEEGEVNEMTVGFKGTMNAGYLKGLRFKIKRGQSGRAVEGLAVAGIAYGYRVKHELDAKGEPRRGLRAVDQVEADIVRRIVRDYAGGMTTREIAMTLNRQGVSGPGGRPWAQNMISGSRARGTGILHNEVYVGRLTYNRQTFSKDPETGRRVARLNPKAEWIVADVPELRIVAAEDWSAAQAVIDKRGATLSTGKFRRPKGLLSGLVFCGWCGKPFTSKSLGRLNCSGNRYHGTCENGRSIRTEELEHRVLDGLQESLAAPDVVAAAVEEYRKEMKRLRAASENRKDQVAGELRDLTAKIDRAVAAILDGTDSPAVRTKLSDMERRKAELDVAQGAGAGREVVELHPRIAGIYRQRVSDMIQRLNGDVVGRQEAVAYVRQLVDRINLHPRPESRQMDIELKGQLAGLFEVIPPPERKRNAALLTGVSVGSGGGI